MTENLSFKFMVIFFIGPTQGFSEDPSCPSFWQVTYVFDGQKMTILDHFIQFWTGTLSKMRGNLASKALALQLELFQLIIFCELYLIFYVLIMWLIMLSASKHPRLPTQFSRAICSYHFSCEVVFLSHIVYYFNNVWNHFQRIYISVFM